MLGVVVGVGIWFPFLVSTSGQDCLLERHGLYRGTALSLPRRKGVYGYKV